MYKLLLLSATVLANFDVRPAGWLDRVALYQKQQFLDDLEKIAPVQINATIQPAPPGYKDSPSWNFAAVVRLLILIKSSKTSAPVGVALRRMLRPTRRFMSVKQSFQRIPSLAKKYNLDVYYDVDSDDYSSEEKSNETMQIANDDDVIVVSNPVEARLPSAQISVKLLREILEARAEAARVMPSTKRVTIEWIPMNKTSDDAATTIAGGDDDAGGKTSDAGAGEVTAGGEGEKTTAGDAEGGEKPEGEEAAPEGRRVIG